MAARSDRALRTTANLVVSQTRALTAAGSALGQLARGRVIVLMDELLTALTTPSTGRPVAWETVLQRRQELDQVVDQMARELAVSVRELTLVNIGASRLAAIANALSGDLPEAIETRYGVVRMHDLLRVTLLELVVLALSSKAATAEPSAVRDCVRALCQGLGARYPGQTIEVRVPPAAAVQVGAFGQGPTHTRGTPPNVAETDEHTWLALATGLLGWDDARERGVVQASGSHVDEVARMLPVIDLSRLV